MTCLVAAAAFLMLAFATTAQGMHQCNDVIDANCTD